MHEEFRTGTRIILFLVCLTDSRCSKYTPSCSSSTAITRHWLLWQYWRQLIISFQTKHQTWDGRLWIEYLGPKAWVNYQPSTDWRCPWYHTTLLVIVTPNSRLTDLFDSQLVLCSWLCWVLVNSLHGLFRTNQIKSICKTIMLILHIPLTCGLHFIFKGTEHWVTGIHPHLVLPKMEFSLRYHWNRSNYLVTGTTRGIILNVRSP